VDGKRLQQNKKYGIKSQQNEKEYVTMKKIIAQ
jgi:hypothetical protein